MRPHTLVSVLAFASLSFAAACSQPAPVDSGSDLGYDAGPIAPMDVLTCTQCAQLCQGAPPLYALCCSACEGDAGCGYANPGVNAGNGTTISMCTRTCGTGADCPPAANGAGAFCVRGLCYQACELSTSVCAAGETCMALYGHSICVGVTCQ